MRAIQLHRAESLPEIREVAVPEPEAGQVLVKVAGAGVCHSDLHIMETPGAMGRPLPFTLGHECTGWVAAMGPGVTGLSAGEPVAVYAAWGCGLCRHCAQGRENYCTRLDELGIEQPGLGRDGAMADYMIVDSPRHLVPLGDLDPVDSAPLTDAALTPYHAIKRSLGKLWAGSTAVVIGVGGLGHMAVQILRAITPAQVIALDIAEEKLELAKASGAHLAMRADPGAVEEIRAVTGGLGAQLVLDFVGASTTVELAVPLCAIDGDLTLIGIGAGVVPVGFGTTNYAVNVATPYWGTRPELIEVLDLARRGAIKVRVERFPLGEALHVYDLLGRGKINGRAVLVPGG
ncbi:NAD(P)-dependent alcohol dehydrogenase [Rhizohabitans arisaemae]|uniref:NAD(P)-dependent alcohol dehydrogenase n=1 Tax=Rhizohabitans arisaemae TaxID=2720610 RepID=UPI0024B08FC5|nr:NAD(P)-dependent alcohol dehydrogenase [Rhizohabitans arisaemae]